MSSDETGPAWHAGSVLPSTIATTDYHTGGEPFRVTVAYGGAIYATLPAAQLGPAVMPECPGDLIALGREIRWALGATEHAVHPADPRLSGIYGTIWFDELGDVLR